MLKVKLLARGKSLKPYISAVSRHGVVQRAFAEVIGNPVGACVKSNSREGMTATQIKQVVIDCAPSKQKGMLAGKISQLRAEARR